MLAQNGLGSPVFIHDEIIKLEYRPPVGFDSFPDLTVIMGDLHKHKEVYICCPGYKWCDATQSCIDVTLNIDCDEISPV